MPNKAYGILNEEETTSEHVVTEQPVEEVTEEILPDLDTEDWYGKLAEDEIFNGPEGPAPKLKGLRRLARPYIVSEESIVNDLVVVKKEVIKKLKTLNGNGDIMSISEVIGHHNFPMASVTYKITDHKGRTWSDSADAFYSNCEELGLYPTAVASSRAEARTLRKMLGIAQHAAEEIVDKDAAEELAPDDDGPIDAVQVKLIEKMLGTVEVSLKDILESVTTREVYAVNELTTGEGRKVLRALNDLKKKRGKK